MQGINLKVDKVKASAAASIPLGPRVAVVAAFEVVAVAVAGPPRLTMGLGLAAVVSGRGAARNGADLAVAAGADDLAASGTS